jgi:phage repressor protein C with HTH and peptisase S24 domain
MIPTRESNPIGQRLKLEMKKRGINSAELSKRADVKTSFIYDVISGKSANPSTVKLARVAESLGISLTSLVESSVHLYPSTSFISAVEDYVYIPLVTVEVASGKALIVTMTQDDNAFAFRKSWIREHLGAAPADLRMLTMCGDNMHPALQHGDRVLIDTLQKSPTPPGIFVLFDGLGLVAKRLEHVAGGVRISSDNAHYASVERPLDQAFIIGRVVWFSREI